MKTKSLGALKTKERDAIIETLVKKDRKLAKVFKSVGDFKFNLDEMQSPFQAIAESIVYQQLTGKVAATIFSRFTALYGEETCPQPKAILATPDTVLRGAGLSHAKIAALKDLSLKCEEGLIPDIDAVAGMEDDEIIDCLTQVRGVGPWTAQMFLIFRLGRPDVMPSGDYGVRKGFALVYGDGENLPSPRDLEQHAERWRPFRTIPSWYMWRVLELTRTAQKAQKGKKGAGKLDRPEKPQSRSARAMSPKE